MTVSEVARGVKRVGGELCRVCSVLSFVWSCIVLQLVCFPFDDLKIVFPGV